MAWTRWEDLSRRQRNAVGVAAGAQLLLLGATLVDLWRRPAVQVRGSKRLWAAAAFVNFAGPLAYFAFGRRRGGEGADQLSAGPGTLPPRRGR